MTSIWTACLKMGFLPNMDWLRLLLRLVLGTDVSHKKDPQLDRPPSNALICREAWESQKGRLEQAQQAYWQIRTSASIVASFAAGGGVAALVAMLVVLQAAEASSLPQYGLVIAGVVAVLSIGLFLAGARLSLRGAMSRELLEIVDPNVVIKNEQGYRSEAELLRQQIANATPVIKDHQDKTRIIARDLWLGVRLILGSIGVSLLLALAMVYTGMMNTDSDQTSINTNPPMPAEPKPMVGGTVTEGTEGGTFQKGGEKSEVTKDVKKQ